jgi:hypothetical protein
MENALKYGFIGGLCGVTVNALLTRFVPQYAARPRIFKLLVTITFPMSGFTIGGERGGLELERQLGARKSYVRVAGMKHMDEHADDLGPVEKPKLIDVRDYVFNNRFKMASLTWISLIVSSALLSNPSIPPAQKVIHARMIAQGAVLTFLLGMAFTSAKDIPVIKEGQMERINQRYFDKILDGTHAITNVPPEAIIETKLERTRRLCSLHVKNWQKCVDGHKPFDQDGLPSSKICVDSLMKMVDCAAPKILPSSSIHTRGDSTTPLATSLFKQLQLCTKSVMSTGSYHDAQLGSMRDCGTLRKSVMRHMMDEGWEWEIEK